MPHFEIKGKGRETGRRRKRIFKAENEPHARALAEGEGFVVESVTRLPDEPVKRAAAVNKAAATNTRTLMTKAVPKPFEERSSQRAVTQSAAKKSDEHEMPLRPDLTAEPSSLPQVPQSPPDAFPAAVLPEEPGQEIEPCSDDRGASSVTADPSRGHRESVTPPQPSPAGLEDYPQSEQPALPGDPSEPNQPAFRDEPIPPWLGLRNKGGGCLPVFIGAIGIGVLLLL